MWYYNNYNANNIVYNIVYNTNNIVYNIVYNANNIAYNRNNIVHNDNNMVYNILLLLHSYYVRFCFVIASVTM